MRAGTQPEDIFAEDQVRTTDAPAVTRATDLTVRHRTEDLAVIVRL